MRKNFKGFTLAEMMVVMLVLTIILAAAAPIMTKKREITSTDSPWRYADNNSDAYFGLQGNQTAMIGQDAQTDNDLEAKLILTGNSDRPFITFKSAANTTVANMFFKGTNYIIGGPFDVNNALPLTNAATDNTVLGADAFRSNTSGSGNVAIGARTLTLNTTGWDNIAIGRETLFETTGGYDNIAIGTMALRNTKGNNTTAEGVENIAIGKEALATNSTGSYNTAVGSQALSNILTGSDNIAIGREAMGNYLKPAGGDTNIGQNTAVGTLSMFHTQYATRNTAVGYQAGRRLNQCFNNTAIGYMALGGNGDWSSTNAAGSNNAVVGANAMGSAINSSYNVAVGENSLQTINGGNYNVAIGYQALQNPTASATRNVAIGYNSGTEYLAGGSGAQDLYLGSPAVHNNKKTKGIIEAHHTASGTNKYVVLNGDVVVTGHLIVNNDVYANRYYADSNAEGTDRNNSFRIVDVNSTAGPYTMPTTSSASSWRSSTYNAQYPTSSDKRLKNIKGENNAGLEEINKLKVFNFTFKKDDKKTPRVGVMAQDLKKVFPNAVIEGEDGYLQIRHEDMFYAVINAIKQLHTIVEALIAEVKIDLAKIFKHDEDIARLQQQNKEIVKLNKDLQNKNEELEKRIDKLEKRLEKVLKELDED